MITQLINEARVKAGKSELKSNAALDDAAAKHSKDMNDRRLLSHRGSDGSTPLDRMMRVGCTTANGECVGFADDPQKVVAMWMADRSHYVILMSSSYKYIGIGNSGQYWTVNVAQSMPDVVTPNPQPENFELW